LGFEFYKESYAGGIKPISIGKGDKAVTVGGETCYPFYQFEGEMPNKPRIAMEVWDMTPEEWPEAALAPFKDVVGDPAAWAKKCVDEFGAEMIVLQLKSADPNGEDASPADVSAKVKKVLDAVDVPLILWGTANIEKDEAIFKQICQDHDGAQLTIGPVEDKNHKTIGAAAMGYGHTIISSSPIDVNLAKQVNILLENLGMPMDRIIVDPTTGGLGYGMEYSYSVMERLGMAAMSQGDDKLQFPLINNLANEVWKCKEAKLSADEEPLLGDPERRGILMEAVGAVTYLMGGSNVLIMRHPESIRMVKAFIDLISDGGSAADVAGITKRLDDVDIDYASLAPEPDLTIEEEKKAAAPAKKAAPKKAAAPAKKAAPKAEEPAAAPAEDPEAKAKAEAEAKAKAEADAAAKAEADAQAKADAEAKAKADAEAKAKADEAAKAEAAAADRAKRDAAEDELRQKRAAEREAMDAKRAKAGEDVEVPMTAAAEQKDQVQKILDNLKWVHRRVPLY
jgi:acetyl-CoA decarbonylase/synthase, CODH/ACS complex subunit delta